MLTRSASIFSTFLTICSLVISQGSYSILRRYIVLNLGWVLLFLGGDLSSGITTETGPRTIWKDRQESSSGLRYTLGQDLTGQRLPKKIPHSLKLFFSYEKINYQIICAQGSPLIDGHLRLKAGFSLPEVLSAVRNQDRWRSFTQRLDESQDEKEFLGHLAVFKLQTADLINAWVQSAPSAAEQRIRRLKAEIYFLQRTEAFYLRTHGYSIYRTQLSEVSATPAPLMTPEENRVAQARKEIEQRVREIADELIPLAQNLSPEQLRNTNLPFQRPNPLPEEEELRRQLVYRQKGLDDATLQNLYRNHRATFLARASREQIIAASDKYSDDPDLKELEHKALNNFPFRDKTALNQAAQDIPQHKWPEYPNGVGINEILNDSRLGCRLTMETLRAPNSRIGLNFYGQADTPSHLSPKLENILRLVDSGGDIHHHIRKFPEEAQPARHTNQKAVVDESLISALKKLLLQQPNLKIGGRPLKEIIQELEQKAAEQRATEAPPSENELHEDLDQVHGVG